MLIGTNIYEEAHKQNLQFAWLYLLEEMTQDEKAKFKHEFEKYLGRQYVKKV